MKYAKEVIDLMGAYPGREWKMHEIIRYARPGITSRSERMAIHMSVWRVLKSLSESGAITIIKAKANGSGAAYVWKP